MLIPIGQENSTVRRHPWISYGLIAMNFVAFILMSVGFDSRRWEMDAEAKAREFVTYLAEHPYLEASPGTGEVLGEGFEEQLAQARDEYAKTAAVPAGFIVERQQETLDGLAEDFLAVLRKTPAHRYGFTPASPAAVTLVTSIFAHAGWLHLIGNMLFLFLTGPFIEDVFGRPLFVALYLLSGFAATGTHAVQFPESSSPLVGASGAIAGVMGAFLIRLGTSRIRFLFMPIPLIPAIRFTFLLPAFVVLPLWLGEQFWYAHLADKTAGGVAWWAHIGGFVFGVAVAAAVRLTGVEERYIHPAIEGKISIVRHPSLERAADARLREDWETARREIRKALAADPNDVDGWSEAYEIALGSGDFKEAGSSALRLLELYVRQGEVDLARSLIEDERVGGALPVRFYLVAASFLEKRQYPVEALQVYQRLIDGKPTDPACFRALFRRGEILRGIDDPAAAREAFRRAGAHPACVDPQLRQAVEKALAEVDKSLGSAHG